MSTVVSQGVRPPAWIISPAADLALLVLTPVLIVPLVSLAALRFPPEQIFLAVVAFASIGHHLPGFLRAYADRELLARYRWRFWLAPPLVFGLALAFSWRGLHGLELVLLLWATWHIMMQTYGFMRIYDLKRGVRDPLTARLDWLLCCAVFVAGVLFSEARVFGVAEVLYRVGMPLPSAAWLGAVRWTAGVAAGTIVVAYAAHLLLVQRHVGVSLVKLLLAGATAWLFWICGSLTTNLLIGVAMFEIFHAVQYYAIVWTYNRRLVERTSRRLAGLAWLFQDRWLFVGCYLLAIAAYGSLRLATEGVSQPLVQQLLLALLTTSTLLHFYYDGFIWKVSERKTQRNLGIDPRGGAASSTITAAAHAAKWGAFALVMLGLWALERSHFTSAPNERRLLEELAAWAPHLPELHLRLSQ